MIVANKEGSISGVYNSIALNGKSSASGAHYPSFSSHSLTYSFYCSTYSLSCFVGYLCFGHYNVVMKKHVRFFTIYYTFFLNKKIKFLLVTFWATQEGACTLVETGDKFDWLVGGH